MPVWRLTEDCIWNSFLSSGKRHLLLTGDRKKGKTTLLSRLSEKMSLQLPVSGITTWAEPGKAVWLKENRTGKTALTGRFDPGLPGTENRMRPVKEGFEEAGVQILKRCMEAEEEWVFIDEIGYLESGCPAYCSSVLALMEKKRLAAAVRKQELPFLTQLCQRPDVFLVDLDEPFGKLGCVIMASGLSRRFGENKLLAEFRGKLLMEWVLESTDGIFLRRVVITRHKEVKKLCRSRGVPVVCHDMPYRSDTIRLGLEALADGNPPVSGCLFCPADQPLLRWETVAAMALLAVNQPQMICRTAWKERDGAPVLFPEWLFEELQTLPAGRGGNFIIGKHPEQVQRLSVGDQRELEDVDRPEDLQRLK